MKQDRIEFGEVKVGKIALRHIREALSSNWISAGPKVKQFELEWSELFDYGYSIAVSSGTDACINACLALYSLTSAKRGDEIIVPALSFIATSNAVRAAGFTPKFVDVKRETLNIDESKIESAVNEKTRAIIAVHTMGRPCEMDVIMEIADRHNLIVIEDACEAHGAKYKGKHIGHFGNMACFSFYIAHLICCGEGGMISTNDEYTSKILSSTRSHGRLFDSVYFDHQRTGLNSKMNDLEASIGLEGIKYFHKTFDFRYDKMKWFRETAKRAAWPVPEPLYYSEEDKGNTNCPHGVSFVGKGAGDIQVMIDSLDKHNIHWKRNFGCIPTQHQAFADMEYSLGDFPESEWIGDNGIHIGCHQYLTEENKARIDTAIYDGVSCLLK